MIRPSYFLQGGRKGNKRVFQFSGEQKGGCMPTDVRVIAARYVQAVLDIGSAISKWLRSSASLVIVTNSCFMRSYHAKRHYYFFEGGMRSV